MITMWNTLFVVLLILNISLSVLCVQNNNNRQKNEDIFEHDLSDSFKIEGSDQGIQRVNLKCGADSMNVMLETEKPFKGVMYTRGSFYKQQAPCFVKPQNSNTRALEMNFQLNECQTQQEGELYSNIVVIQNDPELIMPGDSAFSLECDFRQPRNIDVGANFQAKDRIATGSRITLTSPDPGAKENADVGIQSIYNASDSVVYVPPQPIEVTGPEEEAAPEESVFKGTVEKVQITVDKDEL